jgi:hypothetical protein
VSRPQLKGGRRSQGGRAKPLTGSDVQPGPGVMPSTRTSRSYRTNYLVRTIVFPVTRDSSTAAGSHLTGVGRSHSRLLGRGIHLGVTLALSQANCLSLQDSSPLPSYPHSTSPSPHGLAAQLPLFSISPRATRSLFAEDFGKHDKFNAAPDEASMKQTVVIELGQGSVVLVVNPHSSAKIVSGPTFAKVLVLILRIGERKSSRGRSSHRKGG